MQEQMNDNFQAKQIESSIIKPIKSLQNPSEVVDK